jgi:general secretion pathway protein D
LQPDYARIQKLLERLDNMPRQVLIEVMVAEISLTDDWSMGLEWYLKNQDISYNGHRGTNNLISNLLASTTTLEPTDALPGLTYSMLSNNGNVFGLLNMLATNNNLSVLSSPQVLVLNNETATVNVGDQVPIVTNESGSSTAGDLNRTIQYKDTGIILNVTPRINYDGIILIDIDQQVSNVNEQLQTDVSSPTISTKQVKTKLAVKDGQSILIGGLISRDKTDNETGVPVLKDVPLFGNLFKYQEKKDTKKELLITITPYVIENENVLDQYIREFKGRVGDLKKDVLSSESFNKALF